MAAIDDAVRPHLPDQTTKAALSSITTIGASVAVAAIKGAALHWTKKALGDGLDEAMNSLSIAVDDKAKAAAEDAAIKEISGALDERARLLLQSFQAAERSIARFRDQLTALLGGLSPKQLPLFVLVDELDRCRPSYAISLLERVKHLFEIDNVVFLIATDTRQLRHSIKAVYGSEFEGERYLKRFFDRTYQFPEPRLADLVEALCQAAPIDDGKVQTLPGVPTNTFLATGAEYFRLTPRDAEQIYDLVRSVVSVWKQNTPLQLALLFPLAIAHHKGLTSTGLSDSLRALTRKDGPPAEWSTRMHDGQGRLKQVNVIDVFDQFLSVAHEPLGKLAKREPTGQPSLHVLETVQREFGRGSGDEYPLLGSYQALLRMAGRFVEK